MFHTTSELLIGVGYVFTLWYGEESLGRYWKNYTTGYTVEFKSVAKTVQADSALEAENRLKSFHKSKHQKDDSARAALLGLN